LRWPVEQQELGVLEGLDEQGGRRAAGQGDDVRYPPGLGGELQDVFLALGVDDEAAETAVSHEGGVAYCLAGALEKAPLRQVAGQEVGLDPLEVAV